MKIKDIALSAAYVGQMVVKAICVGAQEIWSAVKYIIFEDPAVEQICVSKFSSDGIGVLPDDAAKVTSIGTIFRGNTEITSFDELAEFEKVKTLNDYSFSKCSNLQSIDLSNIEYVCPRSFEECTNLASVGDTTNITTLKSMSFYKCSSLSADVKHPKLNELGWGAYAYTNIQRVVNLGNVTVIGANAGGSDMGTFSYCQNLQSVILPETLTEIGPYCFALCTNLTSLVGFNNSKIHTIHAYAFAWCLALSIEELSLPYLISLGDNAFSNNGGLSTSVTIKRVVNLGKITYLAKLSNPTIESIRVPSTVTSCANYALAGCSALTTLIIEATTPFPISQYFLNQTPINSGKGTIYVPDDSVEAYKTASNWSTFADIIEPLSKYVES